MRLWMETIFHNPAAKADFFSYVSEIEQSSSEAIFRNLTDENISDADRLSNATYLAHEIKVYRTIAQKFRSESNEKLATLQRKE